MLTFVQVRDVCLLRKGSQECRFLDYDEDDEKHFCQKMHSHAKNINYEVGMFLRGCWKKGVDPHSLGMPLGYNCFGR